MQTNIVNIQNRTTLNEIKKIPLSKLQKNKSFIMKTNHFTKVR